MRPYRHRVEKNRKRKEPMVQALPKDRWAGARTFREADGTLCEVVASGKLPTPDWPESVNRYDYTVRARVNAPKGRR